MSKPTTAKTNKRRGREYEARVARELGGMRQGLYGGEDVSAGPFSVECKTRKKVAIRSFVDQAVCNCPNGKTPLVVIHEVGRHYEDDLVVMRWSDWIEWYGEPNRKEAIE